MPATVRRALDRAISCGVSDRGVGHLRADSPADLPPKPLPSLGAQRGRRSWPRSGWVRDRKVVRLLQRCRLTLIYEETSSVPTLTKMGEITSDLTVFENLPDKVEMRIELR